MVILNEPLDQLISIQIDMSDISYLGRYPMLIEPTVYKPLNLVAINNDTYYVYGHSSEKDSNDYVLV